MIETIFLIVRSNSSRLEKKALRKIGGVPLILILNKRIQKKNREIIVCTTSAKSDNKLCSILRKNRIKFFRGYEDNILGRIVDASKEFKIEKCVIVEGDDLFCDPKIIDKTFREINSSKAEIVIWNELPFGTSATGLKLKKLKKIVKENDTSKIETGWIKYLIETKLLFVKTLSPKNQKIRRPEIRLSVDYKEDLALARKLIRMLPERFTLEGIIDIFDKDDKISKINESVKEKYQKNFEKKRVKYN